MSVLNNLPFVYNFFGLDLKTGAAIIAALGIVHPVSYGCTFFMPISYLLVTVWILVALYFAASNVLFLGIIQSDTNFMSIWIWYSMVFVVLMLMLLFLLALVFTSRKQGCRVLIAISGVLWYILTIYFILVVNSYRKSLDENRAMAVSKLSRKLSSILQEPVNKIKFGSN